MGRQGARHVHRPRSPSGHEHGAHERTAQHVEPALIGAEGSTMNDFLRDVRFGARLLVKDRLVTIVAVLTLALGIGATCPIVSLVGAVLLRPFPHLDDPNTLVWLFETKGALDYDHDQVSVADFLQWKRGTTQFDSLVAFTAADETVMGPQGPERVSRASVSADYFRTLGLRVRWGRDFDVGEDTPGRDHVVILGHAYWQRHFASDPHAVGRTLSAAGTPRLIVGVMPADAGFPSTPDIWIPLVVDSEMRDRRTATTLIALGRLKAGASEASANAELAAIAARLAEEHPATNRGTSAQAAKIADLFVGPFRAVDVLILICAALTVLVASANVGNILLAQGTKRRAEIALRAAFGASRLRIVRQLLTECLLLCAIGGALGLLLSAWALDAFRATMPPGVARQVAMLADLSVDGRWIAVSALMTVGTALAAGVGPALRLAETAVIDAIKEQGQQATPASAQRRVSKMLVAGQIALALGLLTGAVAAGREVSRVKATKLGFEPKGVLTGRVARTPDAPDTPFYHELVTRLQAVPGVTSVGLVSTLPLEPADQVSVHGADRPRPAAGEAPSVRLAVVAGDYFGAAGISILAGRSFTAHDDATAPAVAMLSRRSARLLFSTEEAVSRRVIMLDDGTTYTVVGIVDDVVAPSGEDRDTIYLPLQQRPRARITALLRTTSNPRSFEGPLRSVVAGLDRNQPVFDIRPLDAIVDESLWLRRTLARLLSVMGGVATFLALAGIYGVAAYSVGQRRAELGIRAALGASPRDLVYLVAKEALFIGVIGTTIGLGLSFLVAVALSHATRQSALPPTWNGALAAGVFAVMMVASYAPARQAGRIPPSLAMKIG
jgi:putative ABC transport system permease protein